MDEFGKIWHRNQIWILVLKCSKLQTKFRYFVIRLSCRIIQTEVWILLGKIGYMLNTIEFYFLLLIFIHLQIDNVSVRGRNMNGKIHVMWLKKRRHGRLDNSENVFNNAIVSGHDTEKPLSLQLKSKYLKIWPDWPKY